MKKDIIFFRKNEVLSKKTILKKEEISHLKSLRLYDKKVNIEIRDGNGGVFLYEKKEKLNEIFQLNKKFYTKPNYSLKIATAIPKGNRLDWLLQKCTEIGVTHFYFLNFEYSDRKEINLERSQKIIQEASSQSRRFFLPKIEKSISFMDFIKSYKNIAILHPYSKTNIKSIESYFEFFVIGPEGGLSEKEKEELNNKDIPLYSMNSNILKIETACISISSYLMIKNF